MRYAVSTIPVNIPPLLSVIVKHMNVGPARMTMTQWHHTAQFHLFPDLAAGMYYVGILYLDIDNN